MDFVKSYEARIAELERENKQLLKELNSTSKELEELSKSTIRALSDALDAKCNYTAGHSLRVSRYALGIGAVLRLDIDTLKDIELGGILHDIGKIGIPESILWKPAELTAHERAVMCEHSRKSAAIIGDLKGMSRAKQYVLHHHEFIDGSGYPEGLKGDEIPLGSRVILVADAYDAMTTDRPYRKALGHARAIQELKTHAGRQFDADAVEAMIQLMGEEGELLTHEIHESLLGFELPATDRAHI